MTLSLDGTMDHDRDETVFAALRADLRRTFPALADIRFTHEWGGPVSAPLDLFPVIGHAGTPDHVYVLGCVGHGVSITHLHGQTVRDLVLERDTDLTRHVLRRPPGGPRAARAAAQHRHPGDGRLHALGGPPLRRDARRALRGRRRQASPPRPTRRALPA